jgi:hypothetical protein
VTAQVTDSGGLVAQVTISVTVNGAPSVSIASPADGSQFNESGVVSLTGTASDAEDGDLSAAIAWSSSLDGALGTGSALAPVLSVGAHTVTAQVTDSGGLVAQATIALTVNPNTAPTVSITEPFDGSNFNAGSTVTLSATASDVEDGDLSTSIVWTSSRDGILGTGASLAPLLSLGAHILTAEAIDGHGLAGSDVIALTVLVDVPPTVDITSPLNGAEVVWGTPVDLIATATDPVDGDVGASLQWTSSLDGAIAMGPIVTLSTLSVGLHGLTASATDGSGKTASDQVVLYVPEPGELEGLVSVLALLGALERRRRRLATVCGCRRAAG